VSDSQLAGSTMGLTRATNLIACGSVVNWWVRCGWQFSIVVALVGVGQIDGLHFHSGF
jgi:hypothetical protein